MPNPFSESQFFQSLTPIHHFEVQIWQWSSNLNWIQIRWWLSNPTFSKLLLFQICIIIIFSISQNFHLSCIVFHVYLVFIDFHVFSQHPTYVSLPMLLKHVNRYIFQHHHGKKKKNIYSKIPKNDINSSMLLQLICY